MDEIADVLTISVLSILLKVGKRVEGERGVKNV